MQTVYVDVYFLINFTIDFLSLYFACAMAKIPTSIIRLLIGGCIGALTAVVNLFVEAEVLGYFVLLFGFISMMIIATKRVTFFRHLKLAFCFSVVEMLLGGIVFFVYDFLDKRLNINDSSVIGGSEHRELLILAVIVLASIGVFKGLVSVFSFSAGAETVEVDIRMKGRRVLADALVDTGNLAKDPFDMKAVMLIGDDVAMKLLGNNIRAIDDTEQLESVLGLRLRLIPVSFGKDRRLLIGFIPDSVFVRTKKGLQEVDVVVAIDKEGGRYGGHKVLVPSVVIRDVV